VRLNLRKTNTNWSLVYPELSGEKAWRDQIFAKLKFKNQKLHYLKKLDDLLKEAGVERKLNGKLSTSI